MGKMNCTQIIGHVQQKLHAIWSLEIPLGYFQNIKFYDEYFLKKKPQIELFYMHLETNLCEQSPVIELNTQFFWKPKKAVMNEIFP